MPNINSSAATRVLLVYPEYPETFWSFKYALKFIGKKAAFPPLGLITVAALLPGHWQKKLIDMNIESLEESDIEWADYVFISAMAVQRNSAEKVIEKCRIYGKKIVAGGPLFTTNCEDFHKVDYLVLNEAEITLPLFLTDLEKRRPQKLYRSEQRHDLSKTPAPLWSLVNMKRYASASVQYSRGCPFDCEFCDIAMLLGRVPRTKSKEQVLSELDILYNFGWRGAVFFVDDNFIGNKAKLKKEILPALAEWRRQKKYPFVFFTEASLNLADDDELIRLMTKAGFDTVFLGVETPDEDSLTECGKVQNKNRNLLSCIRKIQKLGMEVQGGFIVGFDSDKPSIFEKQIKFIQDSGIVTAMVGILGVIKGTKLYHRLEKEKRLLGETSGSNTDGSINFIPKMGKEALTEGYGKIIKTIYSQRYYYQRIGTFLKEHRPVVESRIQFRFYHIKAFLKSVWFLGLRERGGIYFWKLILWTLINRPQSFPSAISFAIKGYHFRKIYEKYLI